MEVHSVILGLPWRVYGRNSGCIICSKRRLDCAQKSRQNFDYFWHRKIMEGMDDYVKVKFICMCET